MEHLTGDFSSLCPCDILQSVSVSGGGGVQDIGHSPSEVITTPKPTCHSLSSG